MCTRLCCKVDFVEECVRMSVLPSFSAVIQGNCVAFGNGSDENAASTAVCGVFQRFDRPRL